MSNRVLSTTEEELVKLYKKYKLNHDDFFKHQHYTIITRRGIDKIQAIERINIEYDAIECKDNYAAVKAKAQINGVKIETFGSALKGASNRDGNCTSWYVLEMAEKRAMSRAVLKLTGFYELGAYGQDESEDFVKPRV